MHVNRYIENALYLTYNVYIDVCICVCVYVSEIQNFPLN